MKPIISYKPKSKSKQIQKKLKTEMSETFLETTRKEVMQNRNTAQQKMIEIIEHQITSTGKEITELLFSDPLSGDINFAQFPANLKSNLFHLKTLKFVKGEITSIQGLNLFPVLETVEIPNNLLVNLEMGNENEQRSILWKTLNVENNGLSNLPFKRFTKIENLNLSHNQFHKISDLPESLENLHCEHNRLTFLDLSKCIHLKYVNCSYNNHKLTLIPTPQEIDTEIINDQKLTIHEETAEMETGGAREEESDRKIEYKEALVAYFSTKKKYEDKWRENKLKVWEKNIKKIGKKATQRLVQAVVPKCINCDQPGGMLFRYEDQKYNAQCSASNPCNFHIQLFRAGDYNHTLDFLYQIRELMEEDKQDYIKVKHDIKYGYLNEVEGIKKEKELLEDYELSEKIYKNTEKELISLYSEERQEKIHRKQREIYETISENDALLSIEPFITKLNTKNDEEEEDIEEEERKKVLEGRIEMVVENELKVLFPAIQTLRPWIYDNVQVVKEYREKYLIPISEKESRIRLFQEKINLGKMYSTDKNESPAVLRFTSVP